MNHEPSATVTPSTRATADARARTSVPSRERPPWPGGPFEPEAPLRPKGPQAGALRAHLGSLITQMLFDAPWRRVAPQESRRLVQARAAQLLQPHRGAPEEQETHRDGHSSLPRVEQDVHMTGAAANQRAP